MGIFDLLNKRTLKLKKENIGFISKQMEVDEIEAQKIYVNWKKHYMNTAIDEHSTYHTGAKKREEDRINIGKKVALI